MARTLLLAAFALIASTAATAAPTVLVFGDSLSAGYGVNAGHGWVALLSQKLRTQNSPYQVVNASVSGETTAGGLTRLPAALDRYRPAIVLIELGANDGLRGQPVDVMRANLEKMVDLSRAAHATPVLFEMRIPPNYGPVYVNLFAKTFGDIAAAKQTPLVPFFLGGIALEGTQWFQEDGIHPSVEAQPQLLDAVWPTLAPLLASPPASAAAHSP
jgi:acyl-CoA thioesterase-1